MILRWFLEGLREIVGEVERTYILINFREGCVVTPAYSSDPPPRLRWKRGRNGSAHSIIFRENSQSIVHHLPVGGPALAKNGGDKKYQVSCLWVEKVLGSRSRYCMEANREGSQNDRLACVRRYPFPHLFFGEPFFLCLLLVHSAGGAGNVGDLSSLVAK